jgi:hypothetical protein
MELVSVAKSLNVPEQELEFLKILNAYNVRYLIIGGYAVRYYGHLRPAKDLDVLVNCLAVYSERNCLCDAVTKLVGRRLKFTADDLSKQKQQLSLREWGYSIDILTSIENLNFYDVYSQRTTVRLAEIPVTIISKQHLLEIKRLSLKSRDGKESRQQDLEDIQALEEK